MRVWLATGLLALLLATPRIGHAQGIDCARARSATEKAICGSPTLLALDHQVAIAYADAIARQPDRRDAMRADLLAWLRSRDAACNLPSSTIGRCLSGQLTARLAALAPPPPAPAQSTGQPPVQPPTTTAGSPPGTTALPTVADVTPPDPAIPDASNAPPLPAATLDAASLPAAVQSDTLLHVTSAGRFTIATHSPSGTALQLVDMLAGPTDVAGSAGAQDGRLDQLLDVGTYKLRLFSAEGATGPVRLTVTPFHDAAPPAALPGADRPLAATLKDGEQRAFWVLVPPGPGNTVRIEAAGRALADLRLWRNGRDLTELTPDASVVTPQPNHPLNDLRLVGNVEPGTYLVVAYGGPALPWTDNDASEPLNLRSGTRTALSEGWTTSKMGPFGSEMFELPASARLLRLDLPQPATAELRAGDQVASVAKTSREPFAVLTVPQGKLDVVELRAATGQAYTLRAMDFSTQTSWTRPGTWWVSAAAVGMGADEVPPTFLLEQRDGYDKPARTIASNVPVIGQGAPYHARFNLRGRATLLFETPNGGDVAFSSTGVDLRHGRSERVAVPPGFIALALEPVAGAQGSLDVVVGTPGATPPSLARPLPPDPVLPLGVQTIARGGALLLDAGSATNATLGLVVRAAPVALVEGPVIATIPAGSSLSVPVLVAPGGILRVTEQGVGPIPAGQLDNAQPGRTTVVIPVADHARTVALSWHRTQGTPPAIPAPTPAGQVAAVTAGTPLFLDLARNETRGLALSVPEGGLFRVETLGRLHTSGRLATPFIPRLATADGNGTGQNFLIQSVLRAGRYRVDVRAIGSNGHLGLLADRAPLLTGSTLLPGGSVRASLPGGTGVAFPIVVAGPPDGRYRFDVLSLGTPWEGRLEDAEGWPLTANVALDGTEIALRPGHYRLVVAPPAVNRQVVARLTAIIKPTLITGHGPNALPFDAPQTATWREPDGRDQPRTPDAWAFTLAGPATVTISLGDGMAGELQGASASPPTKIVTKWTGPLEAGDYQLRATSIGRNDRLGYTIGISSPALQPGAPRTVTLPASLPFTLATARVANLTSWGTVPLKATLRAAGGPVIARYTSRADDWNIAAARLLPAGKYMLDVQSSVPPAMADGRPTADSANQGSGDDSDSTESDQPAQTAATQGASAAVPPTTSDTGDTSSGDTGSGDTASATQSDPTTTVTLALPPDLPTVPAPAQTAELAGAGIHVLSLATPPPGTLLVAAAASATPVVLTLERSVPDGWQTVAIATGRDPVTAAAADDKADDQAATWRIEAWTIDGGSEPIRLAARALVAPPQTGTATLAAADGFPVPFAVARASLPEPGLATLGSVPPGLLAGGWPGHALRPARSAEPTPTTALWLLAPNAGSVAIDQASYAAGQERSVQLPAGLPLTLPATADGTLAVWRVASQSGHAEMGLGASLGTGETVALATAPLTVRGSDRPAITRFVPALLPSLSLAAAARLAIPPNTAQPVTLPPGDKSVHLDLGPGLAVFAGWHDPAPFAVYAGSRLTETLQGAWADLLVVNLGPAAAPATILTEAIPAAEPLRPGTVRKRFYGSAGSFAFAFEAPPGARLMTAGPVTAQAVVTAADPAGAAQAVPGRAWIEHAAGPVAVWLDSPGASPWPEPAPQETALPARITLAKDAAAFRFENQAAALLHITTTAPVLARLQQADRTEPPTMFAAGAELHRAVAAGPATLLLVSPDDGPLTGTLSVTAEPLRPLGEGLGETVAVGPGGSAAWGFTLPAPLTIGVGVRAEPDVATVRLLDAHGAVLGSGVAQLRALPAGDYVLEAQVPGAGTTGASPAVLRPALVGITPTGNGPPPDVVQGYLELVGMKPQKGP